MRLIPVYVLLALTGLAFAGPPARAATEARPWYAGAGFGGGAGSARVDGARLDFGRDRFAFALLLRAGRDFTRTWSLGAQLDAVGASSGRVVELGPGFPSVPSTTAHRVAINHLGMVATLHPAGGPFLLRAGPGICESFTEDWDAVDRPVHRRFGPGAVAGLGVAPSVASGVRIPVAVDAIVGRSDGRAVWAVMLTVGFETP